MSAPDFQAFQHAFARHIRDPHHTPRPAGVPARRMAVYNELLFNNITGFLDACFPVCRKLIGEKRWRRLNGNSWYAAFTSSTPRTRRCSMNSEASSCAFSANIPSIGRSNAHSCTNWRITNGPSWRSTPWIARFPRTTLLAT